MITATISQAAALIASHNPSLAACFRSQPFRRVDLALAFAAGFKANEYGDLPGICYTVLGAAYADKAARAAFVKSLAA